MSIILFLKAFDRSKLTAKKISVSHPKTGKLYQKTVWIRSGDKKTDIKMKNTNKTKKSDSGGVTLKENIEGDWGNFINKLGKKWDSSKEFRQWFSDELGYSLRDFEKDSGWLYDVTKDFFVREKYYLNDWDNNKQNAFNNFIENKINIKELKSGKINK